MKLTHHLRFGCISPVELTAQRKQISPACLPLSHIFHESINLMGRNQSRKALPASPAATNGWREEKIFKKNKYPSSAPWVVQPFSEMMP